MESSDVTERIAQHKERRRVSGRISTQIWKEQAPAKRPSRSSAGTQRVTSGGGEERCGDGVGVELLNSKGECSTHCAELAP